MLFRSGPESLAKESTRQGFDQQAEAPQQAKDQPAKALGQGVGAAGTSKTSARPETTPKSDDDVVEETQGHPQGSHQQIYVKRWREDHWVYHEEVSEIEEAERVKRAAKRLVAEVDVTISHRPCVNSCIIV